MVVKMENNTEKIENKKIQNTLSSAKNKTKNKKKTKKLSESTKYFDYYDDIKSSCHKIYDW